MGRMTRAKAAEVAERMHVDEDAVLDMSQSEINVNKPSTPEPSEGRAVLGDLAPNSAEAQGSLTGRKTRAKRNARAVVEEPEVNGELGGDGRAESDAALEADTMEAMEKLARLRITSLQGGVQAAAQAQGGMGQSSPALPEVATEVPEDAGNVIAQQVATSMATSPTKESANELLNMSIAIPSQQEESEILDEDEMTIPEAPSSPVATAVPRVIKSLRKDTPNKRSTSNKENVEPLEPIEPIAPLEIAAATTPSISPIAQPSSAQTPLDATVTQPTTSSPTGRRPSVKSEDAIEALDDLDEAVEKVNKEIPNISASAEKKQTPKPTKDAERPKTVKPAPFVRLTKAVEARLSLAQATNKDASKAPASARPRPSTLAGRASNVRQSVVPATSSRRVPPTTSSATNTVSKPSPRPKKETVIPHSKPRPVSLSFPTPPPAARSSKAPTKSSFQLPGEAVAAKLKAAREERAKREAAAAASKTSKAAPPAEKKPAFKARPAPSTLKKTPSVRHTAASRARDPATSGDAAPKPVAPSSTTGLKRSNTVAATSRPRPSTSTAPTTTSKSRLSTSTAPTAAAKPPAPAQLTVQKRPRPSSVHVSTTTAPAPTPRVPSTSTAPTPAARVPSTSTAQPDTVPTSRNTSATSKGKEVYARFSAARNAAENEKREKEEAARKARAAASERGRVASREWAQKQRVKNLIAKVEGNVAKA